MEQRAREGFREAAGETDAERIEFCLALAEVQLDNVAAQARLLSGLEAEGNLKGPRD